MMFTPAELERANRDLERASVERSQAEERHRSAIDRKHRRFSPVSDVERV